jgi:spermidine synthase
VFELTTAFHQLKVADNNGVRLLKFERNQQSSMRLDDPFETDIEYVRYLHIALAIQPMLKRVLIVGLGGGSFVKRMWRDYPEVHIDAVEIDPDVVRIAHDFFDVPRDDRIRVIIDDGRRFVSHSEESYDLIVIDAFDDDHVPPHLLTDEFMRECRDHLAEDGVIAYNLIGSVHGDHSKPFRSFYRTITNVWRNAWMFPVGLYESGPIVLAFGGNIVVFASDNDVPPEELLGRIAKRVDGRVSVTGFGLLGKDLYQGTVRAGDVPLLVDPSRRKR